MPLVVIAGIPASGKTKRALELKAFFEAQGKEVHVISEIKEIVKAGFEKNEFFSDSNKEKHIRGVLRSEMLRLVTPNNVVILDALNYIKGYRYELFCGTKANKCSQCTVHAEINRDTAWEFNENRADASEKYTREIFDALVMRFEEPDGKNRWDSPLFLLFPDDALDLEAIAGSLFNAKPVKPNRSTQNPPLSATNFLYDLDQTTKKIVDQLIKSKNMGARGEIRIEGFPEELSVDVSNATVQKLMVLRRQYITYSKMNTPDADKIPHLFVQYLRTSL